MSDNELTEFLDRIIDDQVREIKSTPGSPSLALQCSSPSFFPGDTVQWIILPNGKHMGGGPTRPALAAGVYRPILDDRNNLLLEARNPIIDEIVRLPDSLSEKILISIQTFWKRREDFSRRGQLFKRGILIWGPPGGGKTITIHLLIQDLILRNGIILMVDNPYLASQALDLIRKIEPTRPIICILEDIDEIIHEYREHAILALLDGENQVGDIVHVATTNYPEYLPSRLINRPSRFDEIIKVGMPDIESRKVYLKTRITEGELSEIQFRQWVIDTEGLSIAHLRELVIAVFCLGRSYEETIKRLHLMSNKIKSERDVAIKGFNGR